LLFFQEYITILSGAFGLPKAPARNGTVHPPSEVTVKKQADLFRKKSVAGAPSLSTEMETKELQMPTYEYECTSCGHRFEKFQSITAAPVKRCPSCGKKVKRLFGTGGGLIFKGSGFYTTDYRSEDYKRAAKAEAAVHSCKTGTAGDKGTKTDGKEKN
jgi:putative FmdB family regulatory protein